MPIEGIKCNGKVKERSLSSCDEFVTYGRKKSMRMCERYENGGVSANLRVSHFASRQAKSTDIGWKHGNTVNGNRFHWKCKWCNFVGHSGGVTRLKQHLAGGWHVRKCTKVPEDISLTMKDYLVEKKYVKSRKRRRVKADIDNTQVSTASQESKRITGGYKTAGQRSRGSFTRSKQVKEEPQNTMLRTDINKEGDLDRTDNHWRTVLKQMLQLPGGGMWSSIRDALKSCPPGDNRKSEMTDILGKSKMIDIPTDSVVPKERHKNHYGVPGQSTIVDMYETWINDQTDEIANKQECRDAFLSILHSEKFISLCNLLYENFQGIKVDKLFDLNLINSKLENGVYGQSPGLFNQDLQQMWGRIQKVGEEMVLLASSLSNMSQYIHQKQVGDGMVEEAYPQNCELSSQVNFVAKNSNDSDTATQFPSCESAPSTKPNQTEVSCLYNVCTCKQCGTHADVKCSLICDECEFVYHFSCVEPAVQDIPTGSWYCNSCSKERTQSSEPPTKSNTQQDNLHEDCAVCERLEISETKEPPVANGSGESSVSIIESDEPLEPSRTALSHLCKNCGTCEDEDKRFLICGHSHCPYKYYHIRCLKTSQIASLQQRTKHCWYCPSCLCRACFCDQDDDMIVLCDGCDEAYHTYCMKPTRNSIPKGQWYCLQCNVAKAKEGMKRYEQWVLQQHGKKDGRQTDETSRSMDVLLIAVDKLSYEEN